MKKTICFFYALLFINTLLKAQSYQIEGQIVDAHNQHGLSGANVTIAGTAIGTTTKKDGTFTLANITSPHVHLLISFVGYKSVEWAVANDDKGHHPIIISLEPVLLLMDEISITGARYGKKVGDMSTPVDIVDDEKILQTAPRTVADALQNEPGLAIARDGMWGSHIMIRGLGQNNIVTLIDGNRVDTATDLAAGMSMVDVYDIERIETVKGASSALYGTGALGGVVNIITRDGWYDKKFYSHVAISSGYQSVNKNSIGNLRLNIGNRSWYAKASTMFRKAGDVATPQGVLPNSQYKDGNLALRLGLIPFEKHEIKLNYQRFQAWDVGIPGAQLLFPAVAKVTYPEERREMFSVEYSVHSTFADHFAVKYFMQNILRDVENIPYTTKNIPGSPAKVMNVLKVTPAATHDTQGVEVQSDWIFMKDQYFVMGIDGWQKNLDGHREKSLRIDVLDPTGSSIVKSIYQTVGEKPLPKAYFRSIGIFGQNDLGLFHNRFIITTGGRFDKISIKNDQVLNPIYVTTDGLRDNTPAGQTILWKAGKAGDQSWSANLGLLYKVLNHTNVALSLCKSFRSPYLEERFQFLDLGNFVKIGDPDLKPEKGYSGNLGIQFYSSRFNARADIFYNRLNDLVVEKAATFEGRSAFKKANIGRATLYGFDIQMEFQPADRLTFFGNVAHVHGADNYQKQPLPLIPPMNGRLGIKSRFSDYCTIEADLSLFARQDRIANWEKETPAYYFADFYMFSKPFYARGFKSQFFFGIENLTNNSYRNHLSSNRGLVSSEPGRNVSIHMTIEK
jgi:hemoglobin/transferrin/lactoferrin receptor protein